MYVATVFPLPPGSCVPPARPACREVGSRARCGDVGARPRRGPSTRGGLLVPRAAPRRGDDPASAFDDPFLAASRGVPGFADDADAVFGRAFREMDASVDAFERRIDAAREASRAPSGAPRGYRREGTFSQELPGGGTSRGYYRESVVTFGGEGAPALSAATPFPAGGSALWAAVALGALVGAYVKLARRFAANFHRTAYGSREKLKLVAFWPILWLADARGFRDQFAAAVAPTSSGADGKEKKAADDGSNGAGGGERGGDE